MTQTVTKSKTASFAVNEEHNGLEITFDAKPARETLDSLKASGFRWHNARKLWYAKNTPERLALVCEICHGDTPTASAAKKESPQKTVPVNKFGVKVGDLFCSTWGYEQTNNDFFQVVELVGTSSVRVREVYPEVTASKAVSWASEDRTIRKPSELLPPAPHSVFIKDQERGDLKRLKSYAADGVSHPQFYLSSFCDAYMVEGDSVEVYESWYA